MKELLSLDDLRAWKRSAVEPVIRLGVFGDPIEHSLSPAMQNAALKASDIPTRYAAFHICASELADALSLTKQHDFIGLNLTVPHKIAAVTLVDQTDEMARRIGAINTIRIDSGKLRGFNTDGIGFLRAVREVFSVDVRDLRVLLLGAGGAARAIAYQCALEQCERLVIVNRDPARATKLVEELRPQFTGPRVLGPVARLEAIEWNENDLRTQLAHTDLVVNATPIGLAHHDASPVPERLFAPHLFVLDTVYREGRTPLMRAAMEAGARAADGRAMLLHQGAAAFEIWFGSMPPLEAMRRALKM